MMDGMQLPRPLNRASARRPLLRLRFAALLMSALIAGAALAADKPRTGAFGKGKANGPLLTRAELRECLATQERLRGLGAEVLALQSGLDKDKAEIAQLGAALKDQLPNLDHTNADAVAAFNAEVRAHEQRIDAYNARTPSFNARIEAMLGAKTVFAKGCENRDFDEKDEIAIRKGQ